MFVKRHLLSLAVLVVAIAAAQVVFGPAHNAAAVQTGRSYFENAAPGAAYTGGSGAGCVVGLIGYVIPNYTQPDWSQPAGHQCDGSGAVGDMRMNQVAAAVGYGGGDKRAKFYYLLKYNYDFGNAWERAGSSEIALSLLGYGFGSLPSRTISAAQWQDLYDRLTAPDIEFIWASDACGAAWCLPGVSFRFNTAGVIANGRYDAIKVDNGTNNHVDAWVIRSARTGQVYSTYEIECGNGIGNATALPKPVQWNLSMADAYIRKLNSAGNPISGSYGTNVNVNNAVPGERYGFYYRWVNSGSDPTDVTTNLRRTYNYAGVGATNQTFFSHAPGVAGGGGWMYNGSVGNTGTIPLSAVDKTYCMQTDAFPGNSGNPAPKIGSTLCVKVMRSFNLIPTVTVPVQDLAPGDTTMTPITPKVTNAGPTDSYPNTYWQLTRFVIPVGGGNAPGTSTGGTAAPCVYYTGAACGGKNIMLAQGNSSFGVPSTTLGPIPPDSVTGLVPGQQLCYALSVKGYDAAHNPATASEYRYGTPICVKVAKKPKLQIWGGDIRTRGNITTSVSTMGGAQYGSWVEYAAFSTGSNASSYNFASGAGLARGNTLSVPERNLLTFANTPAGSYGKYPVPAMVTTLADQFKTATPIITPKQSDIVASSQSLTNLASGTYRLTAANVNLSGDLKGTSVVLYSSGTVTITGDINYKSLSGSDTFTDTTNLPQLIIIAKTINISGAVKTVNAWLLTTGAGNMINTCSDVAVTADLTTKICTNPLTINGPIMTDTLYLRRTAGADTVATADVPAEVFNLRADTYLWANSKRTQSGRIQTDQLTEAAPRF